MEVPRLRTPRCPSESRAVPLPSAQMGKVRQMEIPEIAQGVWREGHESHLNRLQDSPALRPRWLLTSSCCRRAGLARIRPREPSPEPFKGIGTALAARAMRAHVCLFRAGKEVAGLSSPLPPLPVVHFWAKSICFGFT